MKVRLLALAMMVNVSFSVQAQKKCSIEAVEVQADVESGTVLVEMRAQSDFSRKANFRVSSEGKSRAERMMLTQGTNVLRMRLDMGDKVQLWNEFHPKLHTLRAQLDGLDKKDVKFAMREVSKQNGRYLVNGQKAFMRATDDVSFPLEGDAESRADWAELFMSLQSYGLNSYCFRNSKPSVSAQEAADSVGIILLRGDDEDECPLADIGHRNRKSQMERCLQRPKCAGYVLSELDDSLSVWPVAPLAIMEKEKWMTSEMFTAKLCVSNFDETDLLDSLYVSLEGEGQFFEMTFADVLAKQGTLSEPLLFSCPLVATPRSGRFTLTLRYGEFDNSYDVWVERKKTTRPNTPL